MRVSNNTSLTPEPKAALNGRSLGALESNVRNNQYDVCVSGAHWRGESSCFSSFAVSTEQHPFSRCQIHVCGRSLLRWD